MFNDFRFRVAFRVILLGLVMALFVFMVGRPNMIFAAGLTAFIIIGQLVELYRFTSQTNRKGTRFLESVKYSDFLSGFANDNKLGRSFRELNTAFNEVLEAFCHTRTEKEEHWQYLNTIVQQVRSRISFDLEGQVQLMNTIAKRFIGVAGLKNVNELADKNPETLSSTYGSAIGEALYKVGNEYLLNLAGNRIAHSW